MDNQVIMLDLDTVSDIDIKPSPESANEEEETIKTSEEVTSKLKAAGTAGLAAAAAITSVGKNRHSFETNPVIRKRQRNRLLRKLNKTINEYSLRVGHQAVVIVASPGQTTGYNVFGAKPLKDIVGNMKLTVMEELDNALSRQVPPASPVPEDPSLFELPPMVIDGIPTPLEKMTQAHLRTFIPLMLKYSTGRAKPGWGKEPMRPPWWPPEIPWANIRIDPRSYDEKLQMSWKQALCQIVASCYKYHGRDDLLVTFSDTEETEEADKADKADETTHTVIEQAPPDTVTNEQQDAMLEDTNRTFVTLLDGTVVEIVIQPTSPLPDTKESASIQQAMSAVASSHSSGPQQLYVLGEADQQPPAVASSHSSGPQQLYVLGEADQQPPAVASSHSSGPQQLYVVDEAGKLLEVLPVIFDAVKTEYQE